MQSQCCFMNGKLCLTNLEGFFFRAVKVEFKDTIYLDCYNTLKKLLNKVRVYENREDIGMDGRLVNG